MFVTAFRGNKFAKGAAFAMVMLIMVAFVIFFYLVNTVIDHQKILMMDLMSAR